MKFSIIIPSYINGERSASRLKLTLEGYRNQSYGNYEIILIDDGSNPNINEILENDFINSFENLKILKQPHTGMCSAINSGVKISNGEYIIIGIDDNVPFPDTLLELEKSLLTNDSNTVYMGQEYWLWHVLEIFDLESGEYYPDTDILKHQMDYKIALEKFGVLTKKDILNNFEELVKFSSVPKTYIEIENILLKRAIQLNRYLWLCVRFGALCLRKELFYSLGGIDENFDPHGWYSDLEFGYRIIQKNCNVIMLNNVKFLHLPHKKSFSVWVREQKSHEYFSKKHPDISVSLLPFLWTSSNRSILEYITAVSRVSRIIQPK